MIGKVRSNAHRPVRIRRLLGVAAATVVTGLVATACATSSADDPLLVDELTSAAGCQPSESAVEANRDHVQQVRYRMVANVLAQSAQALPISADPWVAPSPEVGPSETASQRLYNEAVETFSNMVKTEYRHHPYTIDPNAGVYELDCSGFVCYALNAGDDTQPAYADMMNILHKKIESTTDPVVECNSTHYPKAADYAKFFGELGLQGVVSRWWSAVEQPAAAQPGDVIAWALTSDDPNNKGNDTGHVMIVIAPPTADPATPNVIDIPVMDASDILHGPGDTRATDSRAVKHTGIGIGLIAVEVDPATGEPTNRFRLVGSDYSGPDSQLLEASLVAIGRAGNGQASAG